MQHPSPGPARPCSLETGLRRLRAPNPGPMTGPGTNTYLLGQRDIAVIDPGPDDPAHLAAILGAIGPGQRVTHILVTHAHRDHSALAPRLAAKTGAPVLAFGDATAGRSATMARLAQDGFGGGEGVDAQFHPDLCLGDGAVVAGPDWRMVALWTPGHMGNHLCLHWQDAVFTGDLVMGWSSSLISPPDGDMAAFYRSCAQLEGVGARVLYPGHGDPVTAPAARIAELVAHRRSREAQILDVLGRGDMELEPLTRGVYADLAPALLPAAARNTLAHLVDLVERDLVRAVPDLSMTARFGLCHPDDKNPPQPTGRPPHPLL